MSHFVKRCLIYIVGLFILSVGVVCMIKSNTGIAPWDALNVALSELIGLTIGSWVFIVGGILIFINSLIKMRFPNLAGFIPIVIIGSFVDLLNLKVLCVLKNRFCNSSMEFIFDRVVYIGYGNRYLFKSIFSFDTE